MPAPPPAEGEALLEEGVPPRPCIMPGMTAEVGGWRERLCQIRSYDMRVREEGREGGSEIEMVAETERQRDREA